MFFDFFAFNNKTNNRTAVAAAAATTAAAKTLCVHDSEDCMTRD